MLKRFFLRAYPTEKKPTSPAHKRSNWTARDNKSAVVANHLFIIGKPLINYRWRKCSDCFFYENFPLGLFGRTMKMFLMSVQFFSKIYRYWPLAPRDLLLVYVNGFLGPRKKSLRKEEKTTLWALKTLSCCDERDERDRERERERCRHSLRGG